MNTPEEIIHKIFRYCAYQERCKQEIRTKLRELEANRDEVPEILAYLEEEGFVDEDRFARVYAGGKFRVKKWGKTKIRTELRKRGIEEVAIQAAFRAEIPEDDYLHTIRLQIEKKVETLSGHTSLEQQEKLNRFLRQKGYEWELIVEELKAHFS